MNIAMWNDGDQYEYDFFLDLQDVFHELAKKLGYRSKDMTDP